jgi:hypothetical protein
MLAELVATDRARDLAHQFAYNLPLGNRRLTDIREGNWLRTFSRRPRSL